MTTQTLEYLDKTVEEAVIRETHEEDTPSLRAMLGRVKQESRGQYGIPVPDEVAVADAKVKHRENRLLQINLYRNDATALRTKLKAIGVEPLAIITKKAWHQILENSGLYVMAPDQAGRVSFNNTLVKQLRKQADLSGWYVSLPVIVAGILAAYATGLVVWHFDWPMEGRVAGVLADGVLGAVGVMFLASVMLSRLEGTRYRRLVQTFLRTHSWSEVLDALTGTDDGKRHFVTYGYSSVSAKVILPEPPVEVAKVIGRLNKLPSNRHDGSVGVRIAAEAGAIAFAGGVASVLKEARDEMIKREIEAARDPIIYIEEYHSTAVAIVAQYGDFPIERATIDAVVNSEHLL